MATNNFYFKSITSNASEGIEVYIGQNCGNQLTNDILNAGSEVLVVSPYVDESKLNILLQLQHVGVDVKLAMSDRELKPDILRKLLTQKKHTDVGAVKRKRLIVILYWLLWVLALALIYFGATFLLKKTDIEIYYTLMMVGGGLFLLKFSSEKIRKVRQMGIYTYTYHKNLPFKYLSDHIGDSKFIHSKIYVIDRKIAYLGSVNFTNKGFTSNFETRVRITQQSKVEELCEFVHAIFNDHYSFGEHTTDYLGRRAYKEKSY